MVEGDSRKTVVSLDSAQGYTTLPMPEQTPGWEMFWVDEFMNHREPTISAETAQEITTIALAARESAHQGRVVALPVGQRCQACPRSDNKGAMMSGYEERLAPDLMLRTVRDERDIERFAAFNTAINDATQGRTCANLLRHHPQITYDDFFFVEDERTGEVVSTICLIPWNCMYEDVQLDVAMLEMVATHPDYRQRGLVRTQIQRFHQVMRSANLT